jgi:hypothetical protein
LLSWNLFSGGYRLTGDKGLTRDGFDTAKTRVPIYSAYLAYSTTELPLS